MAHYRIAGQSTANHRTFIEKKQRIRKPPNEVFKYLLPLHCPSRAIRQEGTSKNCKPIGLFCKEVH